MSSKLVVAGHPEISSFPEEKLARRDNRGRKGVREVMGSWVHDPFRICMCLSCCSIPNYQVVIDHVRTPGRAHNHWRSPVYLLLLAVPNNFRFHTNQALLVFSSIRVVWSQPTGFYFGDYLFDFPNSSLCEIQYTAILLHSKRNGEVKFVTGPSWSGDPFWSLGRRPWFRVK